MKNREIAKYCSDKEMCAIKHIDKEKMQTYELQPQELHVKICKGNLDILRYHETQDKNRNLFLINFLKSLEVDFSKIDCEFIFNSNDDLPDEIESLPKFTFTRRKNHKNILLPDPHIMNVARIVHSLPDMDQDFSEKEGKAVFAGSYTGGLLPKDNQRFYFSYKNRDNPKGNFKITNFCVDKKHLEGFDWETIQADFISPKDQLKYKYIFNINGNTNCWDRTLWAMNSNSMCLFLTPKREDMSWYYHYFKTFGGFVYVDETDWESTIDFFNNNEDKALEIINNQKKLSKPFSDIKTHKYYFENILNNYNKVYNS